MNSSQQRQLFLQQSKNAINAEFPGVLSMTTSVPQHSPRQELPEVYNQQQNQGNEIPQFKCLSICLSIASLVLTAYFWLLINKTKDVDNCSKLLWASRANKDIWFTNAFIQINYLVLLYGITKWPCLNFEQDLPSIYKFVCIVLALVFVAGTIALQIAANSQDKCDTLEVSLQVYLSVSYFIIAISVAVLILMYIQYKQKKESQNQPQLSSNNDSNNESQRLNQSNNPYLNNSNTRQNQQTQYSTFKA